MSNTPSSDPLLPNLAWPMAGLCGTAPFILLFMFNFFKGIPTLEQFVMMVLGSAMLGITGFQIGKILSTVSPPKPAITAKNKKTIAHLLKSPEIDLDDLPTPPAMMATGADSPTTDDPATPVGATPPAEP
jgi:hypothetical protein